jgi:hypothetical protein
LFIIGTSWFKHWSSSVEMGDGLDVRFERN